MATPSATGRNTARSSDDASTAAGAEAAGLLVLDLTDIADADAVVAIDFVGFGEALVLVPPGAHLIATGEIPLIDSARAPDDSSRGLWERPGAGPTYVFNVSGPSVAIEEVR